MPSIRPMTTCEYLSATDPAAAWNTKEGLGKFGYFTNYLVDTANAVIVDVEATPARLAQEMKATKTMLERVETSTISSLSVSISEQRSQA